VLNATYYKQTAAELHTYFVVVGDEQVLVHNTCRLDPKRPPRTGPIPNDFFEGPRDVQVYFGVESGNRVYVGITNNLKRRKSQHNGIYGDPQSVASDLTRGEARMIEEAIILKCGRLEVDTETKRLLRNKRYEISVKHAYYDTALQRGNDWVAANLPGGAC